MTSQSSPSPLKVGIWGLVFLWIVARGAISPNILKKHSEPLKHPFWQVGHFLKWVSLDVSWIYSLQHWDYCAARVIKKNQRFEECQGPYLTGWLRLILKVDPWHYPSYNAGAIALSVMHDAIIPASRLFHQAFWYYPKDWKILYKAAYHAFYEEKDTLKGALLMQLAAQNGAPSWVYHLAARFYAHNHRWDLLEALIWEAQQAGLPQPLIKAILDLEKHRQPAQENPQEF